MKIVVKVVPKSSRSRVVGWVGDALKICVTAAPEQGRANEAVERLLADALGVSRGRVRVVAGHTTARKLVEIGGFDPAELRRLIPQK